MVQKNNNKIAPLYSHQKRIIEENKLKCGLFLGTGAAKTRTALHLAEGRTLVICPKQQREDKTWQKNAEKFNINVDLTVISKEDLRRDWNILFSYETVIIDEFHCNTGVLPEVRQRKGIQIPKTSQIFEATLNYLKKYPPKRLYLLSATPVSKPMQLWATAKLLGTNWDFFKFRSAFYTEILMGQRRLWIPKKDETTKQRLANLVKKFGYTGSISDFVDIPDQTDKTVYIDLTEPQKEAIKSLNGIEADILVKRTRQRTIANGVLYGKKVENVGDKVDKMVSDTKIFPSKKIDYILERAIEFPKLLIFANYTAQILEIEKVLKKEGYSVSTLTGQTKDRTTLIQNAEKSDAHIVIAQCSVSSGWELPSYPCMIFASLSYRVVDHIQSKGRILRMNKLKKNLYIYLVVKNTPDSDCYKAIMDGNDFIEKINTD